MRIGYFGRFLCLILGGLFLAGCGKAAWDVDVYEKVMEKGEMVIATEGTYAPFSYRDEDDRLTGFDVEVAEAVAGKLGVKARFVEAKWDGLVAGLDTGRYDVVANQVTVTEERLEKYDFTDGYLYSRGAVIVRELETDIGGLEDLKGRRAAQSVTSNWARTAEEYGAKIVGTDGFSQSVELVLSGRADATVNDDVVFYDYLRQKPEAAVRIAGFTEDQQTVAFLFRKGNEPMVRAVNGALEELRQEGTLSGIALHYFGRDLTTTRSDLGKAEMEAWQNYWRILF